MISHGTREDVWRRIRAPNASITRLLTPHPPSLARRARVLARRSLATLACALLLGTAGLAQALCRSQVEVCASGPWLSATALTIEIETPGGSDKGVLTFAF